MKLLDCSDIWFMFSLDCIDLSNSLAVSQIIKNKYMLM